MVPRIKSGLWVQSQVRLCDIRFQGIAVSRRGDPDAGGIVLKLLRNQGQCLVLRRVTTEKDEQGWMIVGGTAEISEETAAGYLEREIKWDRDLWVVEIEDYDERYELDGPLTA
jgi:hypothetical protein